MTSGPPPGPAHSTPGEPYGHGVVTGTSRWDGLGLTLVVAGGGATMVGGMIVAVVSVLSWK